MIGAGALLLIAAPALVSPAPASPQDAASRRLTAGPDRRVELDFQHFYTQRDLDVALASLAAAYPEFLRLDSVGQSRAGHELWVMTVARLEGAPAAERPAIFLAGGLGAEDLHGTEMALFTILELVQNHDRDPAVAALLASSVCYVAPCLNPDLRERVFGGSDAIEAPSGQVRFDWNFPIGWRPDPQAGAYPLSEPETYAAAEFVLSHRNIALVQTYTGSRSSQESGIARADAADRAAFAAVLATIPNPDRKAVRGLVDLPARGGSLLEFAYGQHGAFPFQTLLPGSGNSSVGPSVPEVLELAPLGRKAFQATLRLARTLPSLELSVPVAERLSDDLWQIDVDVANAGLLPTSSALGASRFACAPPDLAVSGAELLAWGVRRGAGPHLPAEGASSAEGAGGRLTLGEIPGGGHLSVRLVVRASGGAVVELQGTAARAGSDRVELTLE